MAVEFAAVPALTFRDQLTDLAGEATPLNGFGVLEWRCAPAQWLRVL